MYKGLFFLLTMVSCLIADTTGHRMWHKNEYGPCSTATVHPPTLLLSLQWLISCRVWFLRDGPSKTLIKDVSNTFSRWVAYRVLGSSEPTSDMGRADKKLDAWKQVRDKWSTEILDRGFHICERSKDARCPVYGPVLLLLYSILHP